MATRHDDALHGITSMATRSVLTELGETYAKHAGQRVSVVAVGGVDAIRRVRDGEAFDFVVLAVNAIDKLADAGRVDPGSRIDLARSPLAIGVAAGAARPDVGSARALREAVLQARTVGYSTGPSGAHVLRLFERWGIAQDVAPRLVQAPPGTPVAALIARGDVELGFQQLSELMHAPGIDVVELLAPEIAMATIFSAAVCSASAQRASTLALLRYLASESADAAKRRHGMEPIRAPE